MFTPLDYTELITFVKFICLLTYLLFYTHLSLSQNDLLFFIFCKLKTKSTPTYGMLIVIIKYFWTSLVDTNDEKRTDENLEDSL